MLTDETLEQCEKALAIQYGIRPQVVYSDFKLNNVVTKLERVVEEIIKNKVQQYQSVISHNELEESALRLGQLIEDLVGIDKTNNVVDNTTETTDVDSSSEISSVNSTTSITAIDSDDKDIKNSSVKGKRKIKWTDEKRRQFLDDCDKLSPEEVRVKYGFCSTGVVFSTKYSCKNALNLNN